jgi:hypothetical protein
MYGYPDIDFHEAVKRAPNYGNKKFHSIGQTKDRVFRDVLTDANLKSARLCSLPSKQTVQKSRKVPDFAVFSRLENSAHSTSRQIVLHYSHLSECSGSHVRSELGLLFLSRLFLKNVPNGTARDDSISDSQRLQNEKSSN